MQHRNRLVVTAVVAAATVFLAALTVVVDTATRADAAAPVALTGPSSAHSGSKVTVKVRVKKGVRGKVALQARRGSRWVTLRSRRPQDGRASFTVPVPVSGGGGGAFRLRAKVGPRTSKVLTIKVRPRVSPDPSDPTEGSEFDARCKAQYGSGTRVLEKEHKVRPLGWPHTPKYAVLCRLVHVSADEEYGCYATDGDIVHSRIFFDYEHALPGSARAPIAGGNEVLTGVFGDSSFYLQQDRPLKYYVVWARDGNYEDLATIAC